MITTHGSTATAPDLEGVRGKYRRPDKGVLPGWSSILRYDVADAGEDVTLQGLRFDGRRKQNDGWPSMGDKDEAGKLIWGQCHNLQVFGAKRGARPEGLVHLKDIKSLNAVADGIQVAYSMRVLMEGCVMEGARTGVAVTGSHVDAALHRCATNQLHYEPEGRPGGARPARFEAVDAKLFGRRHVAILPKAAREVCRLIRCDASTVAYHDVNASDCLGGPPRLYAEDCHWESLDIATPVGLHMVGGSLGKVRLRYQSRYRKWDSPPGACRFSGVQLGPFEVHGVGTLVFEGCIGPLSIDAYQVAGFSPSEDTPLVIWRDGIETRITAPGAYDV